MAAGNSVHDEIREQQKKLKGKSFREKWDYFWEYYRIHTIVIICSVAALISIVHSIASQKDPALDDALVNTYLNQDLDPEAVCADFEQYAQVDTDEYQVTITTNMDINYEETDQYSYTNLQKLTAMAAARTLDVVISNDAYIDHNMESGIFYDLREYFTEEELARYEDRLLYRDLSDDEEGEIPIAIDVRDSKYMITDQIPAWYCITSTAQNIENAKLFLEYLLLP